MEGLLDEFFHRGDDGFDWDLAIEAVATRLNISMALAPQLVLRG